MATDDQAKSREFVYPENCISEKDRKKKYKDRKKYRDRILRENPDILYNDSTSGQTGKRKKSNLTFYTTLITKWKSAINDKYQNIDKTEEGDGEGFTIYLNEMRDKKSLSLTIHFYTTGIVLVQSREENLNLFEEAFAKLKVRVYRERDQAQMNNPNNPPPPPPDNQLTDGEERDQPQDTSITDDFIKLSIK